MRPDLSRNTVGWQPLVWAAFALVSLLPTGCLTQLRQGATLISRSLPFSSQQKEQPTPEAPPVRSATVKIDGSGAMLSDNLGESMTSRQFLRRLKKVMESRGRPAATRWIQKYPDVALETLRSSIAESSAQEALDLVASAHDQQCGRPGESAWSRLQAARTSHSSAFDRYARQRAAFLKHLESGRVDDALSSDLPARAAETDDSLIAIDAHHNTAVAHLLAENPDDAIAACQLAIDMAESTQPYWQAQLHLVLSEAHRRANELDLSIESWRRAVEIASRLAARPIPVTDPALWEQCIAMHPFKAEWPAIAVRSLKLSRQHAQVAGLPEKSPHPASATPAQTTLDPVLLWQSIGTWRFERDEPQAALVAFKRAETFSRDDSARDQLRLEQARALIRLNQHQAATAILAVLTQNKQPGVSLPAYALLGTMKLQAGTAQQGLTLLKRAVEDDGTTQWSRKAEAEADLGIAYLILGDETNGLQWLHRAQQHFRAHNDTGQLIKCLTNEAKYLEDAGHTQRAGEVREQIGQLAAR